MKKHVVNAITGTTEDVNLTPKEVAQIKADRSMPLTLPENTPPRVDDVIRALIAKGTLTKADITNAKKNR